MHLAIGYKSTKGNENPIILYCGNDREDALAVVNSTPSGIVRVDFFNHPLANQRKFIDAPPAVKKKTAKKKATS